MNAMNAEWLAAMRDDNTFTKRGEFAALSGLAGNPTWDTPGRLRCALQAIGLAEELVQEIDPLLRQRTAVMEIHTEFGGRCTHCVERCNCLELDPEANINDCPHGNVAWPCPTAKVYNIAPSTQH